MTEVTVNEIELLPLLSVVVGNQALLLDPETAGDLYERLRDLFEEADPTPPATYQRETVWFTYGNLGNPKTRRNVIPITVKEGSDDILLVGLELMKDGIQHETPIIKSYRTGCLGELSEGHPVSWPVSA